MATTCWLYVYWGFALRFITVYYCYYFFLNAGSACALHCMRLCFYSVLPCVCGVPYVDRLLALRVSCFDGCARISFAAALQIRCGVNAHPSISGLRSSDQLPPLHLGGYRNTAPLDRRLLFTGTFEGTIGFTTSHSQTLSQHSCRRSTELKCLPCL